MNKRNIYHGGRGIKKREYRNTEWRMMGGVLGPKVRFIPARGVSPGYHHPHTLEA